jgi:flagellar biosynthesis protein FliQ
MEHAAIHLMARALETTLMLAVPLVAAVAVTGLAVGVMQTIVQVQDQNVAFLPKLLVVAVLVATAGLPGLLLLARLLALAAAAVPRLLGL